MADYATIADLKAHWPAIPAESEAEATQKLHEASIEIRANFPDLDGRLASGALDPDVARLVVCRMVKRAMDVSADAPTAGLETFQFGTGPFTMGGKVHNPDGNIYVSKADRRLLAGTRSGRAFSIHPGGY